MNNNKVIIFGINNFAELALYYLTIDSPYEVVAFSVNKRFLPSEKLFCELPVVPFEVVETIYPPDKFFFFAPMSPKKMNLLRRDIYFKIKEKGFELINYISSKATIFDNVIGDNCFILENNTVQPFTKIGNNVILWSGNHIGHHGIIEDHVFFSSHVVMSGRCTINSYCFLGVNSSIKDGITLAEGTLVGMSASVMKPSKSWGVYVGNPSKRLKNKKSTDLI